MQDKKVISNRQLCYLVIFSIIPAAILYIPGDPAPIVHQDAWLTNVLATVLAGIFIFYPLADMGMRFPGQTIIQYSEKIAGSYFGKIFGLGMIYYYFFLHIWTLRSLGEFAVNLMPETPIIAFYIIFSLLTVYAVKSGVEVIARCGDFAFPIGLFFLVLVGILSLGDIKTENILPIMENSAPRFLRATLSPLDWLGTGVTFSILTAFVKDTQGLKKTGLAAIGLSGAILTFFSLICIAVFGPMEIKNINFPYLALSEYISVGSFFERAEVLFVMGWVSWIFIVIALSSYLTALGLAQLFRLSDYRVLVIPEVVLVMAYSLYEYKSFPEMSYLFSIAHSYYLIFSLGMPFTLWLISLVRFKTGTDDR